MTSLASLLRIVPGFKKRRSFNIVFCTCAASQVEDSDLSDEEEDDEEEDEEEEITPIKPAKKKQKQ